MEESKALEVVAAPAIPATVFQPIMSIEDAIARRDTIVKFVQRIMVLDQDYGKIPGTDSKPVLLKPGAEKLCSFFGLEPEFLPISEEIDLLGEKHGGEPFYYIRYRCRLVKNGIVMGVGEGSCNSWESKYRYRNANRKCPACGAEAIIKGKEEYGGGWLCFAKKGGCGAKYGDNDKSITEQVVGRVLNPDVADQINTIQKMAQKRALVPATLLATSGSEFFTQDLEDNPPEEPNPIKKTMAEKKQAEQRPLAGQPKQTQKPEPEIPQALRSMFEGLAKPGYLKQAYQILKTRLLEVSPANGQAEYDLIIEKHGVRNTTQISAHKAALLEMWNTAEQWHARQTTATDADLPGELFSNEVTNA